MNIYHCYQYAKALPKSLGAELIQKLKLMDKTLKKENFIKFLHEREKKNEIVNSTYASYLYSIDIINKAEQELTKISKWLDEQRPDANKNKNLNPIIRFFSNRRDKKLNTTINSLIQVLEDIKETGKKNKEMLENNTSFNLIRLDTLPNEFTDELLDGKVAMVLVEDKIYIGNKDRRKPILVSKRDENKDQYEKLLSIFPEVNKTKLANIDEMDLIYSCLNNFSTSKRLREHATHFIPLSQRIDPMSGSEDDGLCVGHAYRYARLASKSALQKISIVSNKKLIEEQEKNEGHLCIFKKHQIDLYHDKFTEAEKGIKNALWDVLLKLDDRKIISIDIFSKNGKYGHATVLRMVNNRIEFYDSNQGIIRFSSREKAVNFLAKEFYFEYQLDKITFRLLPFVNPVINTNTDLLKKEKIGKVAKIKPTPVQKDSNFSKKIDGLEQYAATLREQQGYKAQIKAHEIKKVIKKWSSMEENAVITDIQAIIENKKHTLMQNRGSGFHFFKSKNKSHSTTEEILKNIVGNGA